jgi:transposase InsO family protein
MAEHLRAELAVDALQMALERRQPAAGLVCHSDRGSQGGFNWSSQHLHGGSCDGSTETAVGHGGPVTDAFAWSAAGGAA